MFSILLIIAGFKIGCPLLGIFIVIFFWVCILCSNPLRIRQEKKKHINPIDEYGDKYYGTIDWLYNNKL